jgi:tRNA(adenine34) deaminase
VDDFPAPPPGWAGWEQVMDVALEEAAAAARVGEVPVGAVLLAPDGAVLARAGNAPASRHDPTAHAEILALRRAARLTGNYRLPGSLLVVTLEPCLMCLGAMVHARIGALVYGAADPKTGAIASQLNGPGLGFLNHTFPVLGQVRAKACGELLQEFFRLRRRKNNEEQPG